MRRSEEKSVSDIAQTDARLMFLWGWLRNCIRSLEIFLCMWLYVATMTFDGMTGNDQIGTTSQMYKSTD